MDHGVAEEGVLEEAEFYNLPTLVTIVQERIAEREDQVRKRYEEASNKKESGVGLQSNFPNHVDLAIAISLSSYGMRRPRRTDRHCLSVDRRMETRPGATEELIACNSRFQVMVNANYAVDQSHEFLVIVTRECPDNDTPMDIQDRAGHIQQRARSNRWFSII